jgi:molybdopterin molybdotransferase
MGRVQGTPFFGLPGNPVSSFATFLLFVHPFLKACSGAPEVELCWLKVPANFSRAAISREEYLRAQVVEGRAEIFENQSSGVLSSVSWSSGLVRQKIGESIERDSIVDYLSYSNF